MSSLSQPEKLLWTAKEVVAATGISSRKLWSLTNSGEIPHIRVDGCLRYPVDRLQRWIEAKTQGGGE